MKRNFKEAELPEMQNVRSQQVLTGWYIIYANDTGWSAITEIISRGETESKLLE